MNRLKLFVLFAFVMLFVSSNGQSISDTVRIKEVQVLAKRKVEEAGLKITRPDSLQRVSSLTIDLSELISEYSPVFIKSYGRGSAATASFRGTAATHTQVLWNGMNLNSPMRGFADLSLLPVFFTDEIYLLHGGSSMTKGSGALGGSVHLENTPDWSSDFGLEGLMETGSFQSRKGFFRLQLGGFRLQSSTRIFYDGSENNYPFYNSGILPHKSDTLKNAGYWKAGILQEFYLRHLDNQFSSVRLWFQKSDRNLPQLMSYQGSERDEDQKDEQFRAQYDWKKYSDGLNYHFFSGVNATWLDYYRATPAFQFVNEDSRSKEFSFMNHLRVFRKFDEKNYATFTIDANYHQVEAVDKKTGNGYKKDRLETSLMLNMHFKPSDRVAGFVLVRSENYDKKVVPLIPSLGIEWQLFRRFPVVMRSNVARNYHKPTLNDLYWLPGGNPDLLPEDGYTGDVSLAGDFLVGIWSLKNELTGFVSKIENWITWQPAANGAYYWEANNVKDVLSRGVEYQFTASLNWNKIQFNSGGNYSFTATSNIDAARSADQSRGKQLIYIPKHKGGFYASATWQKITVKYDLNGIGKRYTKSNNQESDFEQVLNPYWLSKLSLNKQLELDDFSANLKFTVDNLFDQTYQSILWRPMPGRFYTFSVALKYRKP
ncbi:iron complex outermembrane recepter protein [Mariniphaga anaerophila]|uniref:Iron complex outermembrane recepter protein n=1 Tax=Mariniphaga anaerophila TaxID=1484053 RepID=A0A1M4SM53_9BACT|nr:TonB-dependent receptor plug domain-containing protein [Mariniphaga anaerophila]SHE33242.1 iron complex outermembrane recepter protein [Mariniphaga anaerophila]